MSKSLPWAGKEEELDNLSVGLSEIDIEGVIIGAVHSVYQRDRVLAIVNELGIEVFAPLWLMDPESLLHEVATRMDAIIVVAAAEGLGEEMLGVHIDETFIDRLKQISARNRIHLAGEGGEYESLTLYAPFYSRPVQFRGKQIVHHGTGRHEMILEGFS